MFNSAFNGLTGNTLDFYPEALRPTIDTLNERIYPAVNNGVYRAGFATSQQAYESAFDDVFAELDYLEQHLGDHRYLAGEYLTEADVRLFTTLIRFDAVYYGHFKCNLRRIADYPNLSNWLRELYQCRAWPRRWILPISRGITMPVTGRSIRRGLCRRGRCRGLMLAMIG